MKEETKARIYIYSILGIGLIMIIGCFVGFSFLLNFFVPELGLGYCFLIVGCVIGLFYAVPALLRLVLRLSPKESPDETKEALKAVDEALKNNVPLEDEKKSQDESLDEDVKTESVKVETDKDMSDS